MIRPTRIAAMLALSLAFALTACSATPHHAATAAHTKPAPIRTKIVLMSKVPSLAKLNLGQAVALLESSHLNAVALDQKHNSVSLTDGATRPVLSQSPAAGNEVQQDDAVVLHVGDAPKIRVPKLIGKHESDFPDALGGSAFSYTFVNDADAENDDWHVVIQNPKAGTAVEPGTQIRLKVGAPQVVYKVGGNGSIALITWTGASGNIGQAADAHIPWSISQGSDGEFYSVSAQDDNGTTITCEIFDDGKLVSKQTSTGRYAIASCSY